MSVLALSIATATATICGAYLGLITWDGSYGSVLFSSLSASYDTSLASCDNIKVLYSDFKSFGDSLDMVTCGVDTHTDMPTNNSWKEFFNYWLSGTATETNWFDASCQTCWDYVKNTPNLLQIGNNLHEASSEQLGLTAKADSFAYGLGWFLIVCVMFHDLFNNFALLSAVYAHVDLLMYNFLGMFDFPGFLVNSNEMMNLGPIFDFQVEHNWKFRIDPGDGVLRLCHMVTYTLHHEYFWFQFNSLSPSWSIRSYLTLTIVPGLDWPWNYDRHRIIQLFQLE